MTLYHGSNQDIEKVDISRGMRHKDFGQGFYLTPDFNTACRMAKKKSRLLNGISTVIVYELDEAVWEDQSLYVLRFPEKATADWARFVDKNRNRNSSALSIQYDIVCGPIADDGVAYLLGRYHEGTMTIEELATELQHKFLDQQVMIGSHKALCYLKKVKTILI